jgi:hypothetical protein
MATIANLDVALRANTSKFDSPLKQSAKLVKTFGASTVAVAGTVVAAFAGITAAVKSFAAAGDAIDKISARTQVAAQDVQSLTFAFEQNGGSASDLETSIRSLNRNVLDLERGSATAVDNFRDLGLSFEDLAGLDQADRFRVAAKALASIEDESLRAGVALKVFGRSGSQILPLIDNLDQLEEQYKNLGISLTDEQIKLAAELTDQWNIMSQSVLKLTAELGELFGPVFEVGIKGFALLARAAAKVVDTISVLATPLNLLLEGANKVADSIFGTGQPGAAKVETKTKVEMPKVEESLKAAEKQQIKQVGLLENISRAIVKLPPVLQQGQASTISFINKLRRDDSNRKIVDELKKMNETESDQLFELRKKRRLQTSFVLRPV